MAFVTRRRAQISGSGAESPSNRSMNQSAAVSLVSTPTHRCLADFVSLMKPPVVAMVLVTTLIGFYLGATTAGLDYLRLAATLLGTGVAAAGTLALNQFMERETDARMHRTRRRPLPDGRLAPSDALKFGATLAAGGVLYLAIAVDLAPAVVVAATTVAYLFAYTPLKSRTSLCSLVGAVPGALPPVAGWVAASGNLKLGAWILFAIMFLWQIPHSLAIAHLHRDDYAHAGVLLLPVVDRDGTQAGLQIVNSSLVLLTMALTPSVIGLAGVAYFLIALALGVGLLGVAARLARSGAAVDARLLLLATLIYLPLLFTAMAADKLPVHTW